MSMRRSALLASLLCAPFAFAPPAAASHVLFAEGFENGIPSTWGVYGLWHGTDERAGAGGRSAYYGLSNGPGTDDNTYDTGDWNRGWLITPAIDLADVAFASLTFWSYWRGEGCGFERPIIQASTEGPTGPYATVKDLCTAEGEGDFEVDLSGYVGGIVHLRFLWDTLDELDNDREGWYLDDVKILRGGPAADLSASITAPSDAQAGDHVALRGVLRNGPVPLANVSYRFLVDGVPVAEGVVARLDAGRDHAVSASWDATPGEHELTLVVDPLDRVREPNEGNNAASVRFVVGEGPGDYSIRILDVAARAWEDVPVEGFDHPSRTYDVTVRVCNEGLVVPTVPGGLRVDARAGPNNLSIATVGTEVFGPLASGMCFTRTYRWESRAVGDVTLHAVTGFVGERDLTDNSDTRRLTYLVSTVVGYLPPRA